MRLLSWLLYHLLFSFIISVSVSSSGESEFLSIEKNDNEDTNEKNPNFTHIKQAQVHDIIEQKKNRRKNNNEVIVKNSTTKPSRWLSSSSSESKITTRPSHQISTLTKKQNSLSRFLVERIKQSTLSLSSSRNLQIIQFISVSILYLAFRLIMFLVKLVYTFAYAFIIASVFSSISGLHFVGCVLDFIIGSFIYSTLVCPEYETYIPWIPILIILFPFVFPVGFIFDFLTSFLGIWIDLQDLCYSDRIKLIQLSLQF